MKKLNKKNLMLIGIGFLIIILGIILSIVLGTDNKKMQENTNNQENKPAEVEPEKLKIVDVNSKTRPYAVMINNISTARPYQSGLQDAYIIYEMIVEGGITRMLALFKDVNVERIGSVRSARHYYLDYAMENDAIYVHHGQSPQALEDFGSLGLDRIEVSESKTGWRDKSLNVASEHTLFTSTEKLANGIGKKRTEMNKDLLLNYSAKSVDYSKIEGIKDANNIEIKYSKSNKMQYEYDETNKVYKRSVNGKEHTDYVTKEQYTFKNIIAYDVKNYKIKGDTKDRQILENIGSGTGYLITEGVSIPIKWSKNKRDAQTIYTYNNGEEIVVNDGNTFIQIYPTDGELTIS